MKLFISLSSFAFTMIVALVAFTYTIINFPTTMRDLLAGAQHVRDHFSLLGLPDSYMIWVDILLQPTQIVFVGFSIATRLAIEIIRTFFGGWRYPSARDEPASSPASHSIFTRWG
jgi:hypothetical protein